MDTQVLTKNEMLKNKYKISSKRAIKIARTGLRVLRVVKNKSEKVCL